MGEGADDWAQSKAAVRPPDQLELTDAVSEHPSVCSSCFLLPRVLSKCQLEAYLRKLTGAWGPKSQKDGREAGFMHKTVDVSLP